MRSFLIVWLLGVAAAVAATGPVWPVPGAPPGPGRPLESLVQATASGQPESALFGCVRTDGNRFHEGLDLAPMLPRRKGEATDPVRAIHDGVVAHINNSAGDSSYGRYVVLEHPDLDLPVYTLYAHLASVARGLAKGDTVPAGTTLGILGRSAGGYTIPRERAHLHLEIGLRLTDNFAAWYRRQSIKTPNKHGPFNGMNLSGWDPLDYFNAAAGGRASSPLAYLEQIPPAVQLHVRSRQFPDFLDRYPQLLLDGCPDNERAGWEIFLSGWGLPLSFKALREAELKGPRQPGEASVVAVDNAALGEYACRRIVTARGGPVRLDSGGRQVVELLFSSGHGAL